MRRKEEDGEEERDSHQIPHLSINEVVSETFHNGNRIYKSSSCKREKDVNVESPAVWFDKG